MVREVTFWHKTVWRLARTPVAKWIKAVRRARVRADVEQRQRLAFTLPRNSLIEERAQEFQRTGYCKLNDLVEPTLLQTLSRAAEEKYAFAARASQTQEQHRKDFWARLLDEDKVDGMLPTDNPFVAFALQPALLSLLSIIYGELPQLDDVLLVLSRPTGKQLSLSQLWHHDYDDVRTVKLYIYITDVSSTKDGPFTFLPAPVSQRLGRSLRSRRSDEEIAARVRPDELIQMIAPRLSVFMVETSRCLHMGSRVAEGHERMMYMASYISIPRIYPEPPPRFRMTGQESEVVRCILTPVESLV